MATWFVDFALGLDTNAGTSAGSGNAWKTLDKLCSTMAGGDRGWVKASGTYTQASGVTYTPAAGTSAAPTIIEGYTSSTGDGGQFTLQKSAGIDVMFTLSSNFIRLRNAVLDANSVAARCVVASGSGSVLLNVQAKGYTDIGIAITGQHQHLIRCRATTGKAASTGGFYVGNAYARLLYCVADATPSYGFRLDTADAVLERCYALANTGSAGDGFILTDSGGVLIGCVAYGNARDGIRISGSTSADYLSIRNCILEANSGYGIDSAVTNYLAPDIDYNAFFNNATAARNQVPAGADDVALTGSAFTTPGTDFSLNNTAGGGAACRGAGYPGALPFGGTGFLDIGGLQSAAAGGGGGTYSRGRIVNG